MTTIHKYPIEITNIQHVSMPSGAQILHAGIDPIGAPCLWALVDTDKPKLNRSIAIRGTGFSFDWTNFNHISTLNQGQYVWHVFEVYA